MFKCIKRFFRKSKPKVFIKMPYDYAIDEIGVKEIKGEKHNARILEYHKYTNLNASTDEVPWCAAFVNYCLIKAGIEGTNKPNAKSFLDWGISNPFPKRGDIVVFWRDSIDSWKGHVGFYVDEDEEYIYCLGGNQDDSVSIKGYEKEKVLDFRTFNKVQYH